MQVFDLTELLLTTMETKELQEPQTKKIGIPKRQAINLAQVDLVKMEPLTPGEALPLVIQPNSGNVSLADWARENRDLIVSKLYQHGGILFRGFGIKSPLDFEKVASAIAGELFGDYGDLPRACAASEKIYQSTPYPPDKYILFHNESSHLPKWPMKQFFVCLLKSKEGGETPILDCRKVAQKLDPALLAEFRAKGLMYVRNFIEGVDVSWQQFFHTEDRAKVEASCRGEGMDCEWWGTKNLRIRQRGPAVVKHPKTGETVFFNQVQLHHTSCLDPETRKSLRALFKEEEMPRSVYFGDGSPISDEIMEQLNKKLGVS